MHQEMLQGMFGCDHEVVQVTSMVQTTINAPTLMHDSFVLPWLRCLGRRTVHREMTHGISTPICLGTRPYICLGTCTCRKLQMCAFFLTAYL